MIPAKRLAEIQERGGQTLYPFELAELVTAYEAARELLDVAEHAMSLMTAHKGENGPLRLYHPCDGCHKVMVWLQANGRCTDVLLSETEAGPPLAESEPTK